MKVNRSAVRRLVRLSSGVALLLLLTSCAPTQQQLSGLAHRIAQPQGMVAQEIATEYFTVMTYARITDPQKLLRIYLEGDGKAWITRTRISLNPTPHDPLALRLAAQDEGANVVYVARPCQYVNLHRESHCNPHLWSQARYSEGIVQAINTVIDHYAARMNVGVNIELVGYSGGGALAVLVAQRREDVTGLRTVAANLDTELFTQLHQVSPLTNSLNPAAYAAQLQQLPQRHYVGAADTVIPEAVAHSYRRASGRDGCVDVYQVAGASHSEGWQDQWPALLAQRLPCTQ